MLHRVILFLSIIVLNLSCYPSKELKPQLRYLEGSKVVIAQYYKTYEDKNTKLPEVRFNKKKNTKNLIERNYPKIKNNVKYDSLSNYLQIKYLSIKPYIGYESFIKTALDNWAITYDNSKNGEELYYKLINYWLLPNLLICKESKPIYPNGFDIYENAILTEIDNLAFMANNGYPNKFKNFTKLILAINNDTRKIIGDNVTPFDGFLKNEKNTNFIEHLYYKTSITLYAMERIKTITDKKEEK